MSRELDIEVAQRVMRLFPIKPAHDWDWSDVPRYSSDLAAANYVVRIIQIRTDTDLSDMDDPERICETALFVLKVAGLYDGGLFV